MVVVRDADRPEPLAPSETRPDRRRPGRVDEVNPELLPLLRDTAGEHVAPADLPESSDPPNPSSPDQEESAGFDEDLTSFGDRRAARGIVIALLLSAPVWAVLCYFLL